MQGFLAALVAAPSPRRDRLARGLIVAAGALCFLLLAWGHLGLGALVFPPARTAPQQVAHAGALTVALTLDSGQLTAAGPNIASFGLTDSAGHAITNAVVTAHPVMRTMPMDAPTVVASADAAGQYVIHPKFAMAGDWRLVVTISRPGQATQTLSFNVNPRWH